jgi:hypothetical protein
MAPCPCSPPALQHPSTALREVLAECVAAHRSLQCRVCPTTMLRSRPGGKATRSTTWCALVKGLRGKGREACQCRQEECQHGAYIPLHAFSSVVLTCMLSSECSRHMHVCQPVTSFRLAIMLHNTCRCNLCSILPITWMTNGSNVTACTVCAIQF